MISPWAKAGKRNVPMELTRTRERRQRQTRTTLWILSLAAGALLCPSARAQVNCSQNSPKLACVIPNALNLTAPSSENLGFLNEAVGSQVGALPLASPASGIIYVNDPKLNLPVPSSETLGPILTQRPETIGRHKFYVAATYQFFRFEDIDNLSLKQLPIVLNLQNGAAVTVTNNRLDLSASQFGLYFTYGLTDKVDVSIAIPILDIHERFITSGTEYSLSPASVLSFQNQIKSGQASGIGDEVLAAKGTIWKPSKGAVAVGAELRLPTGDALNFLGSGTVGFKPYISATYGKRLSPHVNLGYEVNGHTILVANSNGGEARLPNRFLYSAGADWGVTKWITVAADVLAQRVFGAERVRVQNQTLTNPSLTVQTLAPFSSSYNRTDGSFGVKIKTPQNIVLTGNILVKLDHPGLRARMVPLAGISYTF